MSFFSFSSSSTSSEIRLLDTRLAARWSSRRIGSSLLFSLEKNFTLARKGIRRIEWVLVRMQKSDQCLRVVVYVIGLNEMESSTNCKWLHHPNLFFNFEFREDLIPFAKKLKGFLLLFFSIISLLDYVETWQRPRSGHPSVRLLLLLLEMDFSYFYFQRNGLRPKTRRISIFFRYGNGQRPPALNIIFYRLQTPTSGHSCLMTDIFWAAMEFYFFIYIFLYSRFRVSVFFEQHSLSIHNFWKADEKELSVQLVPPSPTVIDRFFFFK